MKGSEDRYLHDRVKRHLLSLIGASPSGAKLPSRTRLAKDLSVARTTIERAVSELIGEGYLRAVDGSGTYVASRRPTRRPAADGAAMNWGLVIPDIVGDTFPQILRGLEDYAHKVNCHVIVCNSDNDYAKQYAYLLRRLRYMREGESNVLDQSMILFGSGIRDGDRHDPHNLPILLAGRAGGRIETGQHLSFSPDTPLANLYVKMLDAFGAPVERFADSTGPLSGI